MDVAKRWIYAADKDQPCHKGRRSLYYVELNTGSNVVATISSIGMVTSEAIDATIAMFTKRQNMSLAGPWTDTKSGRHSRQRAIVGIYESSEIA